MPAPPAPAPNVTLKAPLANAYAAGSPVAATSFFSTIAAQIDTQGPVATWATQATTLQAYVRRGRYEPAPCKHRGARRR